MDTPALPDGFQLELPPASPAAAAAPLPPGFKLETPAAPATSPLPDGFQLEPDLNAIHPVTGRPNWAQSATDEINQHPGLDKGGQMAVMAKWEQQAHGNPATDPAYGAKINQDLTPGQRAMEYTAEGLGGLAAAGRAPVGLIAPGFVGRLNKDIAASEPPVSGSFGNRVARGVGAAVPMVATGFTGATLPQFAGVGAASSAGEAAAEGKGLPAIAGEGLKGAAEGYLTGRVLGGAQQIASGVASPVARALTAGGIDIGGNAAIGAGGQAVGNLMDGRPIGEGVGAAATVGAIQGAAFAPGSAKHAEIARHTERVNQILQEPAAVVDFPGGSAATAAREIARASTGRDPVWFASDSPRVAYYDPLEKRMFLNADHPEEAVHEAGHALLRGELKPHVESFIADHRSTIEQAADNYADRAQNAGENAIADKVRSDANARADEGFAGTLSAGLSPQAIADLAKSNPSAFMRAYERVLGVVDKVTGGNRAAGRLVERQLQQFIEPLRANLDVARAKLLEDSPAMRDEAMLDRLDPQMTEAARDAQASREMRGQALRRNGEIEQEEGLLDRLDEQLTHAARAGRVPEPTQQNRPAADELQARPGDEPLPKPMPVDPEAERERLELEAEDREAARRARVLEYSHEDLRAMPSQQLQRVAETAGVHFDAPSTTIPRILDAQQQTRLQGMSSKQLWDSVRSLGLRAGSREENIATLMGAGRNISGKTQEAPIERQVAPPPETAPNPAESAAGEGAGYKTGYKKPEIAGQNQGQSAEPAENIPKNIPANYSTPDAAEGISTVELRRQARAKGINPKGTREQLLASLGESDSTLSKSPSEGGGGAGEERFSREELKEAGHTEEEVAKIEADAAARGTNPTDHPVEHQAIDRREGAAHAGDGAGPQAGQPSQEPRARQSPAEIAAEEKALRRQLQKQKAAQPKAKRESGPPLPRGFRPALEEKLLAYHRQFAGEGFHPTEQQRQDSGTDLAGDSKYVFYDKLPGEVKRFLEGRPEARNMFRVSSDPAAGRGADVLAAMGDDAYFEMAQRDASGKAGELRDAVETARRSEDPTMQFAAAVHDAIEQPAGERGVIEAKDAGELKAGMTFTFQGENFRVDEDAGGMRILRDGDSYPEVPLDWMDKVPLDKGTLKQGVARPASFYEPEARPVDESKNIFGAFAPQKATGAQEKMTFETEPVRVPIKQQEESAGEAKARKNNANDANQLRMGEEPGQIAAGPDKIKGGRTSFEVSAGDARLTVEQERPGGKTWRVVRKGQTLGEVSRATSKTLAGGLSRSEAHAEAERVLNQQMGKQKPPAPDEPQSLNDLPDDDIPFSVRPRPVGRGNAVDPVAEQGAKEEADPKSPMATRLMGAVKRVIGGARRQVSIDPVPNLSAAGVGDSAVAHAAAKIAAPWVVRDMIAKSLPENFKDPKVSAELADILLKNRYLGAYQRFKENNQSAQADAIAKAHDLEAFDKDVKKYWNDPATRSRVEAYIEHTGQQLNQLYKEAKGAGEMPDFRAPRQGKYFDAYVPIRADIEGPAAATSEGVDDYLPANNALNASVRKDKFDKRATYTGDFGTDLEGLLTAVVAPRLNEVTKLRFYKDLIDKGVAIEQSLENEKPADIQGKAVASLDLRMPRYDPATGKTTMPERRLFVRADLVREIRDVLDTDQRAPENKFAQLLTKIQVAGLADAAAHGKNMFARLFLSQGSGSRTWDILKANPVIGVPATIARLVKTYREISADTPATRSELAEMAQAGLLRSPYEPSKFLEKVANATGYEWMKHLSTGETLHHMDTAARLILNRQYSELVAQGRAPDTTEGRRDFVLRLGNYNRRLMGPWMRTFRDGGFSPFIVAARNYNRSARELLTGNPGFKGADKAQRTSARLTQLGMLASLALTAPLINMITTGTPGGRDGTPTGAIDFGGDDSDGSHSTWDVLQLAGLRRGLRSTGADSVIEGVRQGKDANTIAGNAVQGITNSALHPWIGPAPSFVFKALTGRQLDIRGKMEAQTIPEGGALQYLENLRAATESQNPLMYALTRPAFQAAGLDQKPADEEKGFLGGLGSTLAKIPAQAAGLKDARPGKDAAEDMADRLAKAHFGASSMTPEDAGKFQLRTGLLAKLRSDPEEGQAAIEQAVEDGKLSEREAANLHKKVGMSGLAWNVKSLGAADAAKVYEAATDEEKESLRGTLLDKIAGSKEMSAGQQDAMLVKLGIEPPDDLAVRRELHGLQSKAKAYNNAKRAAQSGDRAARARLNSLKLSQKDQNRLSKLKNISSAIKKAKSQGAAGAGKVKRLVAAA